MTDMKLGAIETHFADLIWVNEPISSGELVKLCKRELSWEKSTTYTVLRRLCERGIFQNIKGTVTSRISKDEFLAAQSKNFVEETFGGSLLKFLTAFSMRKKLSNEEIDELQRFIDEMR